MTPFSGIKPGSRMRWTSRGFLVEGKVHLSPESVSGREDAVRTLCGRQIKPGTVFQDSATLTLYGTQDSCFKCFGHWLVEQHNCASCHGSGLQQEIYGVVPCAVCG